MQKHSEILDLAAELAAGLQDVSILWQLGVVLASLLLAWSVGRALGRRLHPAGDGAALKSSPLLLGGWSRIVSPLAALGLVLVSRWLLRPHHTVALLDLAVALLFSFALVQLAVYLLRHAFHSGGLVRYWERVIGWVIWIGLALHLTGLLAELHGVLESLRISVGKQEVSLLEILTGMLSVAITVVIALWLGRVIETRLQAARDLDSGLRAVFSKLAKTLLVVIAVLIALPLVGIDLTVLSVFGGAVGVGIGFGLQKIAANYISGFIILLDRSISPGALIQPGRADHG
jgi:small-conductance mechanosensitive channel